METDPLVRQPFCQQHQLPTSPSGDGACYTYAAKLFWWEMSDDDSKDGEASPSLVIH